MRKQMAAMAAATAMASMLQPVGTTAHAEPMRDDATGTTTKTLPEDLRYPRPWTRANRRTRGHADKDALDATVTAAQAKRERKAAKRQRDADRSQKGTGRAPL